jgi:hypothetical protein
MFGFPLVLSPAAEWGIFLGHDFERWPSRLVATAAQERQKFSRPAHVVCGILGDTEGGAPVYTLTRRSQHRFFWAIHIGGPKITPATS